MKQHREELELLNLAKAEGLQALEEEQRQQLSSLEKQLQDAQAKAAEAEEVGLAPADASAPPNRSSRAKGHLEEERFPL